MDRAAPPGSKAWPLALLALALLILALRLACLVLDRAVCRDRLKFRDGRAAWRGAALRPHRF